MTKTIEDIYNVNKEGYIIIDFISIMKQTNLAFADDVEFELSIFEEIEKIKVFNNESHLKIILRTVTTFYVFHYSKSSSYYTINKVYLFELDNMGYVTND